jgi:hypothetical protein
MLMVIITSTIAHLLMVIITSMTADADGDHH